jgi:hypothetical protein
MHVKKLLYNFLSPVMHQKRLCTLVLVVMGALKAKRLSLSELGRAMALEIKERSCIRRSDRFLGNKKLHRERLAIQMTLARKMIGDNATIDIIVDWSNAPNSTHQILRAALAAYRHFKGQIFLSAL